MNLVRIAVLVLGVAAAGGAAMLALNPKPPAEAPPVAGAPAPIAVPAQPVDQILVAAHDLTLGKILTPDDLTWLPWPKDSLAPFMIMKDDKAIADISGSIVRGDFYSGEPIRRERLVKGPNSGFLSAELPTGMRAVAITIDAQGGTSAGGFVLPNDRVDVVLTTKAPGNATDAFVSRTLLSNVKVLAIGQSVADKNGATNQVGTTATLELNPVQTETVILAQRTGQLSLALRSMLDAHETGAVNVAESRPSIIRFGVESDALPR